MAGRVLRRAEGIARKSIVQCQATSHPFTATAPPAVQYVEAAEGWRSIGLNDRVERTTARMLELLVRLSRSDSREGTRDGAASGETPAFRGLRRVRAWNYRVEEARDRFLRRREAPRHG